MNGVFPVQTDTLVFIIGLYVAGAMIEWLRQFGHLASWLGALSKEKEGDHYVFFFGRIRVRSAPDVKKLNKGLVRASILRSIIWPRYLARLILWYLRTLHLNMRRD